MKRVLSVAVSSLLMVGLLSACGLMESAGLTPRETPTPTPRPFINQVCEEIDEVKICGSVSVAKPVQNATVTVFGEYYDQGQGVSGFTMDTTWRYKTTTVHCSGTTDDSGIAECNRSIGRASPDHRVEVDVEIDGHQVTTWFTPR